MSRVELRVIESVVNHPETQTAEYKVRFDVLLAQGISACLFVVVASTNEYSHPATVFDLNYYPDTPSPEFNFYRKNGIELSFPSVQAAREARAVILSRVRFTTLEWAKVWNVPFGGTKVEMFDSGDA
jgi:hypothetical protein